MNTQTHSGWQPLKIVIWLAVIGVLVLVGIMTGFWLLILPLGLFTFTMGRGARTAGRG